MKNLGNALWVVAIVSVAAVIGWAMLRPAEPLSEAFAGAADFREAAERAAASGRPVLAVVSADWCPPCKALKRGALSDERVVAFVEDHTVAVVIDADEHPAVARELGVSAIPTSLVLRDGVVVSRVTGNLPAGDYLAWLESAVAAPTPGG